MTDTPAPTIYGYTHHHDAALKLLMAPIIPLQRGDLPGLGLLPPQANALLLGRYRARCSAARLIRRSSSARGPRRGLAPVCSRRRWAGTFR